MPPFRFADDGWIFDPFHWMGPQCVADCYPDKLFHLLAGIAIAGAFAWAYARWRGRAARWWAHAAVVPIVAALKELHDWILWASDASGFWRDQGPSWRDFLATLLGQGIFWGVAWVRHRRGARTGSATEGPSA